MTSNMIDIKGSFGLSQVFSPFSGPVHTNPFSNENGAVLLGIRLSSTLQRRKRSPKRSDLKTLSEWRDLKTMLFENALFQCGRRKRCYLKTVTSSNRAKQLRFRLKTHQCGRGLGFFPSFDFTGKPLKNKSLASRETKYGQLAVKKQNKYMDLSWQCLINSLDISPC